jgi:hypothetical protein
MTPTQRTLAALHRKGLKCGIVEKWNPFVRRKDGGRGIRMDLFGFIDIIALDPNRGVIGVQSTGNDFAGHDRKIRIERRAECTCWLLTPGAHFELWAWRKVKVKRGMKKTIYEPRIKIYTLDDLDFDPFEDDIWK